MFNKASKTGYLTVLPGIKMKTLVYGNNTLLTEFVLQKNAILPEHNHINEQTGYLVSGHICLTIDNKTHDVFPGDSWNIPSNAKHSARIIEESIAVEVFSPVREDYLPKNNEQQNLLI